MYGRSEGGTRVTVKKETLLAALKKNREGHRSVFLKAQEGFRRLCVKRLDEMLANAREGKVFAMSIGLQAPQDHTKEYDVNIQMLEMSEDEKLVISEEQFRHFVQDDWEWREDFLTNSAQYT
jgi:hypothetical protein